jgi:DNA polymerase-3 subunit gamma/tau
MQSSVKYRPRSLDEMVGQEKTINRLRGQYKKKKMPHAIMLTGKKGSGKTSLARIIALSLQCTHQTKFGIPCKACRLNINKFPIYQLDCGRVRGVDQVENFVSLSDTDIVGRGKRKVFIFDEAHRLSGHSQDSLLKSFEDTSNCTWIICSTRPDKIVDTLRSRCAQFALHPLNKDNTTVLVERLLQRNKSKLAIDDLVDALVDNKVDSARLIAHAVDNYIAGDSAEDASQVEGTTSVDAYALIRATTKGDWTNVSSILQKSADGDLRLLRNRCINYLRTVLLESAEVDDRSTAVANAIKSLGYVTTVEDSVQLAVLSAELFSLCETFSNYKI